MTVTNCFRSDVQQLVCLIDELEASTGLKIRDDWFATHEYVVLADGSLALLA